MVVWCDSVFYGSERHRHGEVQAPQAGCVNNCNWPGGRVGSAGVPGAHKNWQTYEGLPVLYMAQAKAMDCRLDLERSAEKGYIVGFACTFENEGLSEF